MAEESASGDHTEAGQASALPMRTLWVCAVAGGLFQYRPRDQKTALGLEAHVICDLADEFDEVAAGGRTLDVVKVPAREKEEVLAAFAAHKNEVTGSE